MAPGHIASPRKPAPPNTFPIPQPTPHLAPPCHIPEPPLSKSAAAQWEGADADETRCESRGHRMLRLLVACRGLGCEAKELLLYQHEVSETENGFLQALVSLSHHAASMSPGDEIADLRGEESRRTIPWKEREDDPALSRASLRPSSARQSGRKSITRFKADDFIELEKTRRRAAQQSLSTVELPRTKLGMALRATIDHYVVIIAQQSHWVIYDEWMLLDSVAATSEHSARTSFVFNIVYVAFLSSWAVSLVSALLAIVWLPVAILSATETLDLFLDAGFRQLEVPCVVILDMFCGTTSCICVFQLSCIHWSVQKRMLKTHTGSLLSSLFALLGYATCAGTLLPNPHHLIFLITRTLVGLCIICADSIFITLSLRNEPKSYERRVGTSKKKGWLTWLTLFNVSLLAAMDICRHWLMIYGNRELAIITFKGDMAHPLTGKPLGLTNTQLADSMYIGTIFLTASGLASTLTTRLGEVTLVFSSQFIIG